MRLDAGTRLLDARWLEYEDVKHYKRKLKVLSETDRIMGTIRMKLT
ncbi:MAG: hypothetical protein OXI66_12480 [Boseongicola sp.]|nr:hypothetical protein [Boseongicola sp.]